MVPQMGWNSICIKRNSEILEGVVDGDMFYFVHSFHCVPDDQSVIAATTEYGVEVTAAISKDNLSATQFHPEKSGEKGLKILKNFERSTRC
jgi:glutamine amidotransferase